MKPYFGLFCVFLCVGACTKKPQLAAPLVSSPPQKASAPIDGFTTSPPIPGSPTSLSAISPHILLSPMIVTGLGAQGYPRVRAVDPAGALFANMTSLLAYEPDLRAGITVAAADFNADGIADIVTGAGPGGGPHVKVLDGKNGSTLGSFMAYSFLRLYSFLGGSEGFGGAIK